MNFIPELFFKITKFICKNKLFQSSRTKNELHVKFKDKNNSLTNIITLETGPQCDVFKQSSYTKPKRKNAILTCFSCKGQSNS